MSVKILHLYDDVMDQYGDVFNLTVIKNRLGEMDIACDITIHRLGGQFPSLDDFDMVYMGHGKGRNLEAIAREFVEQKEALLQKIEEGKVFLITGNARLLLGREFEAYSGDTLPGIGLFDYTATETREVFTRDVVGKLVESGELWYGYVNRTAHIEGENTHPLFEVLIGVGDDRADSIYEGNHYKNLFTTWLVGPILVKNPVLLRQVLKLLAKNDYKELEYSIQEKALALTLDEFHKELNK